MEAARVARLRGHKVILYERSHRLGGQLLLAAVPPHKDEIANLATYLSRQIEKLGVAIELGRDAKLELISGEEPDEVILATGALPQVPEIPGFDQQNVFTSWDVLAGTALIVGEVILYGGGMVSCETAELLSERGHKVTIVYRRGIDRIAYDLEQNTRRYLLRRLSEAGVKIVTDTEILRINSDGIDVLKTLSGREEFMKAETVVFALGSVPNRELAIKIGGIFPNFHLIGDCLDPRTAMAAVYEGSRVAREI
jgi:pyruvate/2-oxoglutarate dehydrogenase complex dihydrolipoamide dehydrogenase (E3) component